MKNILFICHGNICRSPMAEFVMKDLVKKAGLASRFHIESAATSREEIGNPVYPPAQRKLAEHGISCDGHAARPPTSGKYDLILGIRPEQISISRERTSPEQVEAHVYAGMPAGSETLVAVRVGEKLITVKELGSTHYGGDEVVYLSFDPKKINVFDAKSENLIKYCR